MILYVNGCSHTAACDAAVHYAWAKDDPDCYDSGEEAHPENLKVSWGKKLSEMLDATDFYCDAQSGGSNPRIIRTTRRWINDHPNLLADTFMILQWTTWEREEWLHEESNYWYQVNASGIDHVPPDWRERYKKYVASIDWQAKTQQAHEEIWNFHCELKQQNIKHLFFSGHSTFSHIQNKQNWGVDYIDPYDLNSSYNAVLKNNGFEYTRPFGYHFGKEAHCFWAKHVLQYIYDNNLIAPNEICTD